MSAPRARRIGILTSGGDSPGLNAAIRSLGKTAIGRYGMQVVAFRDGFRGLSENRFQRMGPKDLSGILTIGGTILGTSREKPHRMLVDGQIVDRTGDIVAVYKKHRLDALVTLGGGGTAKNSLRLAKAGLNVVQIPKTIDNDIAYTDTSIGFATALDVATDAIDRLHSTAHSHHRIVIVEVMGHRAGWLTLASGVAGGADVILLPEIPYSVESAAAAIRKRVAGGSNFSIVAVAEGARQVAEARAYAEAESARKAASTPEERQAAETALERLVTEQAGATFRLAAALGAATELEARVTILGYVQRGGTPSPADRLLATRLGTAAADLVAEGKFGCMVASRGDSVEPVELTKIAGNRKTVPADHLWIKAAREVGVSFGD